MFYTYRFAMLVVGHRLMLPVFVLQNDVFYEQNLALQYLCFMSFTLH